MRRIAFTLLVGLALLRCGSAPASAPAWRQLLTGPLGCYAGGETGTAGTLEVDPTYGTRFDGKPVMWPAGFSAVPVGNEIEVRDEGGHSIARTGRRYYISLASADQARQMIDNLGIEVYPAAANCGYPWDFVECSTPDILPLGCRT